MTVRKREVKELHQKTLPELKKLLEETRGKLLKLAVEMRGGKVKDYRSVTKAKDDIARLSTVIYVKALRETK